MLINNLSLIREKILLPLKSLHFLQHRILYFFQFAENIVLEFHKPILFLGRIISTFNKIRTFDNFVVGYNRSSGEMSLTVGVDNLS